MTAHHRFQGLYTALVTPFRDGAVDEQAFRELVQWQIESGVDGLVPVGTTGESPTLSHEEHKKLVQWTVEEAKGRIPVMAGAGSNNTADAISFACQAEEVGADGVLIVTPYYNKPTQEGLYQHYKAINDAVGIPIVMYNIPGRSVIDMSVETMARLYELPNIVGVKDATANIARVSQQRHVLGSDFIQLSGEDVTALAFLAHGGHGCISVASNVAPSQCAQQLHAAQAGDFATALAWQDRLFPLHTDLFAETNPTPAKYALSLLGRMRDEVRLPLVPVSETTKNRVKEALAHAGIMNG